MGLRGGQGGTWSCRGKSQSRDTPHEFLDAWLPDEGASWGEGTIQLSKSKKTIDNAKGGGPAPPRMDAPLSHKVTKVHTFSFLAIPVILRIVAQTGHKQEKHASFPPYASSPHFLVFSYSAKGKSHFKQSVKSTHLLAPCDHNCARRAHKPAFPDLFR